MMPVGGMRMPHAVPQRFASASDVDGGMVAHWEAWARAASHGERRAVAVSRLKECLASRDTDLSLSDLGLCTLPDYLPDMLARLDVSYNNLKALPAGLPPSLICLIASFNAIDCLPERLPVCLRFLAIDNNCLQLLPETLPAGLLGIDADDNQLMHLPVALPPTLITLKVCRNNLIALPLSLPLTLEALDLSDNWLTAFPFVLIQPGTLGVVHIARNDFSQEVLQRLHAVIAAPDYDGPCLVDASPGPDAGAGSGMIQENAPRPVEQVVSVWYPVEARTAAAAVWRAMADEPGAAAFLGFLDELGQTVCAASAYLYCHVGPWLSLLASKPALRAVTFAIAQDATATCDDRVVLTLNHMQQVRMVHDVDTGGYDADYAQLVACARIMFRHECLEQIARKKIEAMAGAPLLWHSRIDQIEIYLALQVKLAGVLELNLMGQDMRYFSMSYLTAEQLMLSERAVKEEENARFPQWLSGWPPWQRMVQRQNPLGWAATQNRLRQSMEAPLQRLIWFELQPLGLENDEDAIRIVGKRIAGLIEEKEHMALLTATLERQRSAALILPVWALR